MSIHYRKNYYPIVAFYRYKLRKLQELVKSLHTEAKGQIFRDIQNVQFTLDKLGQHLNNHYQTSCDRGKSCSTCHQLSQDMWRLLSSV